MKYLLIAFGAVLCAAYASANFMSGAMGAMGIDVPKECEATIDKYTEQLKKEVHEKWLKKEKCPNVKCKLTFGPLAPMWGPGKGAADSVFKYVATTGKGPDIRNLKGDCAQFNKDMKRVLWKEVDKIVDECVLGPKSVGKKDLSDKNPCTVQKKDMEPTGECIKGKAMPLALEIVGLRMDPLKKCMNGILKTYCNEKFLGSWFKYHMNEVKKDRKIYGKLNPYSMVDAVMADCKAHT